MPVKKKAPVKKAPAAKKAPVKKAAAKKAAPAAAPRKITAVKEAMTKTQILNSIAESTELSRKQVQSVLDELGVLVESHVKPRAVGHFTIPGLMKVMVVRKPATKARKGINPFNGEETIFKAKPARNVVKVRPLKKLKDMAEK
ncbi:MAG: integration host factor [Ketobacter sp.]|nr:MAG: integration host factor [Ketobacter sp.]